MSYKIRTIENFDRQAKKLAKHYHSFKTDFVKFLSDLQDNPYMGDDLGDDIRKVRIALHQKEKVKAEAQELLHIQQMSLLRNKKAKLFCCRFMISRSKAQYPITK